MVYGFAIYKILYTYIFSKKKKIYVFYFFCQLLFSLKVTISTEKINANAAKDLERRCRGIPLENAPPDMFASLQGVSQKNRIS